MDNEEKLLFHEINELEQKNYIVSKAFELACNYMVEHLIADSGYDKESLPLFVKSLAYGQEHGKDQAWKIYAEYFLLKATDITKNNNT